MNSSLTFIPSGTLLPSQVVRRTVTPIRKQASSASSGSKKCTFTMGIRDVEKVVMVPEQPKGIGARVRRSIGRAELPNVDPFLLLDEFRVKKPGGFPDHPHRGMQTVTYMLEGAFKHTDNKGHSGVINANDLQWMLAGKGIVHSEMPVTDGNAIGLQLWVNVAAKEKMSKPDYQEITADEIPLAKNKEETIEVKVIAGKCFGVESGVFTFTPTLFWDVSMLQQDTFQEDIPKDYNALIYVLDGKIYTGENNQEGTHGSCIVFGPGEGIKIKSEGEARFIVLAGKPLNEPIVQQGLFAMNTRQEISEAYQDYRAGKF